MKISKKQKLAVQKIAKKYHLKLIIVFGSYASGRNRPDSDFDIGVLGEENVSFADQIKLINSFTVVFKKNIDLAVLNRANPLLLFEASKKAVLLFGSQEEFFNFKLYAFKSFHDYKPFFKIESELNKKLITSYDTEPRND